MNAKFLIFWLRLLLNPSHRRNISFSHQNYSTIYILFEELIFTTYVLITCFHEFWIYKTTKNHKIFFALLNDELSLSLSWLDYLRTESKFFFILFEEINQILLKVSFILMLLFNLSGSTLSKTWVANLKSTQTQSRTQLIIWQIIASCKFSIEIKICKQMTISSCWFWQKIPFAAT